MAVHARRPANAEPDDVFEPSTGVGRKTLAAHEANAAANVVEREVVSASSEHPMLMVGAFAVAAVGLAVPTLPSRIVGSVALLVLIAGHEVVTCRRVDVTREGVRVVVDEETEELVPWSDIRGVTRRRIGRLEMLTLDRPRRTVRIRLVSRDPRVVDAIETAIRAALGAGA